MAITNGYARLEDVKARLVGAKDGPSDARDNRQLESIIEAVSRWMEGPTVFNRRFYATTETRYYTPLHTEQVIVNDLLSVTTLKTDDNQDGTYETTWTESTDFLLTPRNASLDGQPFTSVRKMVNGTKSFPMGPDTVEINGSFGYSAGLSTAAPLPVKEYCILTSMRLWERRNLIFGAEGSADLGTVTVPVEVSRDGELRMLMRAIGRRITV